MNAQLKLGNIPTSETEIIDIMKAWFAISFAFAAMESGSLFTGKFYAIFIIASITVGIGFLLHELGHKIVAQRYGCFAEFRSFDQMLIITVLMAIFFRVVIAAPGAVMISGNVNTSKNGKISAAGPIVNLVLALFFLVISLYTVGIIKVAASYGVMVNSWLALFNMIPLWNFDGAKILLWNKPVYGAISAVAIIFMITQRFI